MARIKLSPLITSINGKLGNAVFQGGKSGIILRQKVTPRKTDTSKQVAARNRLATVKSTWQNLNDTQRDSWISFASFYQKKTKFNSTKILTPYEVFMQHNTIRYQGDYDILEQTTFEVTSVDMVDIEIYFDSPIILMLSLAMVPEDFIDNVAVYITKPFRKSAAIAKSELRFLTAELNPIQDLDITSKYLDLFKKLPELGQKVLVKMIGFSETSGWTSKPNFEEYYMF
jgi:hypothetical protein